ncbi:hypothetical protein F5Y14DRAFT_83076 [Nemania sp. NC0429]|nr:hypothetical protein F5Y14DRAFT_83076 [Nemania sp. NC0429]
MDKSTMHSVVQVVTWILLASMSLIIGFRFLTRFYIKAGRSFLWDDLLILLAYLFAIGECVTVLLPGSSYYKQSTGRPLDDDLTVQIKTGYARDILLLFSLAFAKFSACAGLFTLSPQRSHRLAIIAVGVLVAAWLVSSVFATAFQCGPGGPWKQNESRCIDELALRRYVSVTNIVTDASLIAIPIFIIVPLQMTLMTCTSIIAFYLLRTMFVPPPGPYHTSSFYIRRCIHLTSTSVIGVTSTQLAFISRPDEEGPKSDASPYDLLTQLVQFTSIFSSCVVYFWPFIKSLQSGFMRVDASALVSQYPLVSPSKVHCSRTESTTAIVSATAPQYQGPVRVTREYQVTFDRADLR